MFNSCPGMDKLKSPTITEKKCPDCGNTLELFSCDTSVTCDKCGFVAYNDIQSCVDWCKNARLCVGEDLYKKLKGSAKTTGVNPD
ncbi:MAG: hypothetical protein GXY20_03120 [Clostridiales bacterium]|nr:hypothetical protein [Clostridiales bacterium]